MGWLFPDLLWQAPQGADGGQEHPEKGEQSAGLAHGKTPRPRINLVLYHVILALHACWRCRRRLPGRQRGAGSSARCDPDTPSLRIQGDEHTPPARRTPLLAWADLMRRAFDLDVLACPRCGGRMRLIATIEDPQVIRTILAHVGLSTEIPHPCPPWPAPACPADLMGDMPA